MQLARAAEKLFNFPRLYRAKFALTNMVLQVVRPALFRTLVTPADTIRAASITAGSKVCEIGCGDGANYRMLVESVGDVTYTGLDINPHMVEHCRTTLPHQRWMLAANTQYEFASNEFDYCLIVNVLHHLNSREDTIAMLQEAGRIASRVVLFEPLQSDSVILALLKKLYWSVTDGGFFYPRLKDYHEMFVAAGLRVQWERYSSPLRQFYGVILDA